MPETSIIIRAFNEEKHLPALLAAIRRQTYRDVEVIVVDSGSVDRTLSIAAASSDKLIRIDRHNFTFGYSLNAGIRAASGKWIVIVSAHTLPLTDQWLAHLLEPFRVDQIAMVFGRQIGGSTTNFSEWLDLRRLYGPDRRVLSPGDYIGNNAHAAIRKDLWDIHPFDESLPGLEDIDWARYWMNRKYQVVYNPAAKVHHFHEETSEQVRRRYYREAVAWKRIGIKNQSHLVMDSLRELQSLLADLGQSLSPTPDAPAAAGWLNRCRDIFQFRLNKGLGALRGLMDGAAMDDEATREKIYFDRTGKAVVVHGPGRSALDEMPIPSVLPGEVLIRVAYVGICSTDLEIVNGTLGYYKSGMAHYPIVPGHEFSGVVAAAGAAVQGIRPGDRVVVECIQSCGGCPECRRNNPIGCPDRAELGVIRRNGGYAEYVVVPARFVHVLPAGFDLKTAALCEPLAVVLQGLRRLSGLLPDATAQIPCGVVGAGSIGHLCAKVLARRGFEVTAFDRSADRLRYLSESGIRGSEDIRGVGRCELVVEATGDPEVLNSVMRLSAPGSTILLLGLPYGLREFSFESVVAFNKSIVGSVGSGAADFDEAIRILPALDVTGYFQCVLPLSEFEAAWSRFAQKDVLKILLEVNGEIG